MIDFLRGKPVHVETDYVVLDVHGVGYRVFVANPMLYYGTEEAVTVFIHHHVREDAILLYGFSSREEQTLFRRLTEVSGIGPKMAIGILSAARPEDIVGAVQQENLAFLKKLPGIGLKTAQRMVLDLKDKLTGLTAGMAQDMVREPAAASSASFSMFGMGSAWPEAKLGLAALGYSEAELDRVWPAVKPKIKETDTVDVVMKVALQALFKG